MTLGASKSWGSTTHVVAVAGSRGPPQQASHHRSTTPAPAVVQRSNEEPERGCALRGGGDLAPERGGLEPNSTGHGTEATPSPMARAPRGVRPPLGRRAQRSAECESEARERGAESRKWGRLRAARLRQWRAAQGLADARLTPKKRPVSSPCHLFDMGEARVVLASEQAS